MQGLFLQLTRLTLFALAALWSTLLGAQDLQNNKPGSALLRVLNDSPHQFTSVFLDQDSYTGQITLSVQPADVGKSAAWYVVGSYQGKWFQKNPVDWQPWDARLESLVAGGTVVLSQQTQLQIFQKQELAAGNYHIYAAYQVPHEPMVVASSQMDFSVQSVSTEALHRFDSDIAMATYLKLSMEHSASNQQFLRTLDSATTTSGSTNAGATTPQVSTTNVQEVGVDEADTIKTDGKYLYTLRDCGSTTCVVTFALDAAQAKATEVGVYEPQTGTKSEAVSAADSMYLVQDLPQAGNLLVTLSGHNQYLRWFDVWHWSGNKTTLEFLNAADPARVQLQQRLVLDGTLVASRRIGNALYVVTRFTPAIEGYVPYAQDAAVKQANATLLAQISLSDLIPKATFSNRAALDLVKSENCYLATSSVDAGGNPSMITITTIPLGNPAAFNSTCYLGSSETLYMTPQSLFLATTSNDYRILAASTLIYDPKHETAIHKFALTGNGVDYRGSGTVQGHLGWSEDKRSFRMGANGANDAYLNVVTSIGDSWGSRSSTRLSVLKETAGQLQTIKTIDGIGKPGEQLYAARFLGKRAYLVTFRVIDPLYVLDLADPENPRIVGELEIDGYSDYLHPVSDTLLLGIGKDAIPDDGSSDFDFARGAWYQGVKLSLFDVANPAAPREINSLVFGKRGSDSEILHDHHAIAFLPAGNGNPARFTIPIQVHATIPAHEGFDPTKPNAWYDFTRRGLFEFEVSTNGLKEAGYIEADSTTNRIAFPVGSNFGDRSVLLGDSVFYVRQSEVLSAFWGQKK